MSNLSQFVLNHTEFFDGVEWQKYIQKNNPNSFQFYNSIISRYHNKISRGDLLRLAQYAIISIYPNCRGYSTITMMDFIAGVFIWGLSSTRAKGPKNVDLGDSNHQALVRKAIIYLCDKNLSDKVRIEKAYLELIKIKNLGPSFLTKILYFLSTSLKYHFKYLLKPFPIILDQFILKSMTYFVGKNQIANYIYTAKNNILQFQDTAGTPNQNLKVVRRYLNCCDLYTSKASALNLEPDTLEYLMFFEAKKIGPAYQKA